MNRKIVLSAVEKIILENLDKEFTTIERAEDNDILVFTPNGYNTMLPYTDLFQFIEKGDLYEIQLLLREV